MGTDIVTALTGATSTFAADVGAIIAALAAIKIVPRVGRWLLAVMKG